MYLGNGDGTFQTAISFTSNLDAGASFVIGDFNGDGKSDILAGNAVYLGNGDGTFQSAIPFTATNTGTFTTGDFNGDGKLDLALADPTNNAVDILLGNGDGTFQSAVLWSAGTKPQLTAVGDFNGDGRTDLAVALAVSAANTNQLGILLGADPPVITTNSLPAGTVNASYTTTLAAS